VQFIPRRAAPAKLLQPILFRSHPVEHSVRVGDVDQGDLEAAQSKRGFSSLVPQSAKARQDSGAPTANDLNSSQIAQNP
jgi:hypothetical protein